MQNESTQTAQEQEQIIRLVAKCKNDPLKYSKTFYPWGEGILEKSPGPRVWQGDILDTIGKHIRDPKTRYQPCCIAIASGHDIGKAQPKNLILHTPDGLKKWGDIKVGDFLFDENGNSIKVRSVHEQGIIPVYKIKFDDGSETFACANHLWNVRGRKERRNQKDGWRTLRTFEIIKHGIKRKNGVDTACQWEIPVQEPVKFIRKKVPIEPYTLGVWLGDGGRNSGRITSIDKEVTDHISETGEIIKKTVGQSWGIVGLQARLRNLGVLDKYSYQKSVPSIYMENDIETRAEVLRGLLDTDGEINKTGTIIFNSTSYALATDVIWLVRSLSGKAKFQPTVKKPYYCGPNGEKKLGRDCWRVTIRMPDNFKSFYILRKQERVKNTIHRNLVRWIESIEYFQDMDSMCVKVDSHSGLYLTNDFIVTHNTACISMVIDWAMKMPDTRIVVTASTEKQLRTKTWVEVEKWNKLSLTKDWFSVTATGITSLDPDHVRSWRADAVPWSEENTEAFQGLHNKGNMIVVIFDEASGIADKIWEVTEGILFDEDTVIIWLAFGNPTKNSGRFRECFGRFKHRWITKHIDSRNVEGTNKEQIARLVQDYGEDNDIVRVRVRGEFPNVGDIQFIPSDIVEEARRREPYAKVGDPRIMGVDVSRFGGDESVICFRVGRDAASKSWLTFHGVDTMELAARIVDEAKEFKADMIFVDEGGIGGGVIDRLNALRMDVVGVQFGGKADRTNIDGEFSIAYANKRAEMWGMMKDWLKGGSIPDDPDLATQLTTVEYGHKQIDGIDKILLEKKEDMKKRGLSSPDRADALALTFAYPVIGKDHTEVLRPGSAQGHQINYDALSKDAARGAV